MRYFSVAQQWVLLLLGLLILTLLYIRFYRHSSLPSSLESAQEIVIEVAGEVRNPGIHLFDHAPTLMEAIDKAGGLREQVSFGTSLSEGVLRTGTLLTIFKGSEPDSPPPSSLKRVHGGFEAEAIQVRVARMEPRKLLVFSIPLDLNRVSVEDLCLIPGIGESLAQDIVAYRKKRKRFRAVQELKNVKGVGEKKYESLKPFFTAEP